MKFNVETVASDEQVSARTELARMVRVSAIPDAELAKNLTLFLPWQETMRVLFIAELYRQIIEVPGVIIEFGTRWGRNLSLLSTLRTTLEPLNHNRKIVGFDTFRGLLPKSEKDGHSEYAAAGSLAVTLDWKAQLEKILSIHERGTPYPHIKKHEVIEGDAVERLTEYLGRHPETIIALAYFDMDLYEPTKKCLERILDGHVTKGTVIAFDEVNHSTFPGETIALREVVGLRNVALRKSWLNPLCGYYIVE